MPDTEQNSTGNRKKLFFHIVCYLVCWLPIFLVSYFTARSEMHLVKWALAIFMLIGWCANTAVIARTYRRGVIAGIFVYLGINLLIISILYVGVLGYFTISPAILKLAGALSFTLVSVIEGQLFHSAGPREIYSVLLLFGLLTASWVSGTLYELIRKR